MYGNIGMYNIIPSLFLLCLFVIYYSPLSISVSLFYLHMHTHAHTCTHMHTHTHTHTHTQIKHVQSPDLNPIEMIFHSNKSALKKHSSTNTPLDVSITPNIARSSYFRHCRIPLCDQTIAIWTIIIPCFIFFSQYRTKDFHPFITIFFQKNSILFLKEFNSLTR